MTLGEALKYRLLSLLNEGPFGLKAGLRDEDKYGRKLRAVYRGSLSLGDVLVKEGTCPHVDRAAHALVLRPASSACPTATRRLISQSISTTP